MEELLCSVCLDPVADFFCKKYHLCDGCAKEFRLSNSKEEQKTASTDILDGALCHECQHSLVALLLGLEFLLDEILHELVVEEVANLVCHEGEIFNPFWIEHVLQRKRWFEWLERNRGKGHPPHLPSNETDERTHPNVPGRSFLPRPSELKEKMPIQLWAGFNAYFVTIKGRPSGMVTIDSIIRLLIEPSLDDYKREFADHTLASRPSKTKKQQKIEEKRAARKKKKGGYASWSDKQMGVLQHRLEELDKAKTFVTQTENDTYEFHNFGVFCDIRRMAPRWSYASPHNAREVMRLQAAFPPARPQREERSAPPRPTTPDGLSRFVRMAALLRKKERHHARQTALNALESERRAEVRAAAAAAAAEKAAAAAAVVATPGPSGPSRPVAWLAPAPSASEALQARTRREIGVENRRQHEEAVAAKEARRVAEVAQRLEAVKLSREIGGS